MQHIKELVHPELLGQERKTKTEGATVQFTPVINAKPASVFSYCINLDGISQERDFEKSESLSLCKGNRTRRDLNRPGVRKPKVGA